MRIQPFTAGDFGTNAYIIYDFRGSECILVDAPFPYDRILGFIGSNGLKPSSLLLTHGHFDHIFGIPALRKAYPETRILIASEDMHFLEDNAAESARMDTAVRKSCSSRT